MDKLTEKLDTACNALKTLQELIGQENIPIIHRDAAIQRFEYTFEATWKAAKIYLTRIEGIEAASPKKVIRSCFQVGILTEKQTQLGLEMVDDRNLTSHTYHKGVAEGIYCRLADYAGLMQHWLDAMRKMT